MRINHYMAALKHHLDSKKKKASANAQHVELGPMRMQKDELAVRRIIEGLQAWVPNPWSPSQPLINISTGGVIATDEMVKNVRGTEVRYYKRSATRAAYHTKYRH